MPPWTVGGEDRKPSVALRSYRRATGTPHEGPHARPPTPGDPWDPPHRAGEPVLAGADVAGCPAARAGAGSDAEPLSGPGSGTARRGAGAGALLHLVQHG